MVRIGRDTEAQRPNILIGRCDRNLSARLPSTCLVENAVSVLNDRREPTSYRDHLSIVALAKCSGNVPGRQSHLTPLLRIHSRKTALTINAAPPGSAGDPGTPRWPPTSRLFMRAYSCFGTGEAVEPGLNNDTAISLWKRRQTGHMAYISSLSRGPLPGPGQR